MVLIIRIREVLTLASVIRSSISGMIVSRFIVNLVAITFLELD